MLGIKNNSLPTRVTKIEISHKTVVFTVSFLLVLWLFYRIREILLGFFISLILMTVINPVVDRMEKMKIPRIMGIVLVYLLAMTVLAAVIAGLVPPLIDQTTTMISWLPRRIEDFGVPDIAQKVLESQLSQLGSIPADLVKISFSVFTNLVSVFAIFVITFYLLTERKNLDHYLHILFHGDGQKKAERLIAQIEKGLGGWVRAELTLMVIVGVLSYAGLRLLGIEFALPLALLAGILEVIPNIGPVISGIPAVLAGLMISPLTALAVAALYFLIQQVENTFLVPQIMSQEIGVKPLITILALAVGFEVGGIVGAALAVPALLLIKIIFSEVFILESLKKK